MPNKTVFKNTVFEDKTRPPIKKENVYCNSKRNFRAYNEKKNNIQYGCIWIEQNVECQRSIWWGGQWFRTRYFWTVEVVFYTGYNSLVRWSE